MSSKDLRPEWILSIISSETDSRPLHKDDELITAARSVWPRVRAIALKQIKNQGIQCAAEITYDRMTEAASHRGTRE